MSADEYDDVTELIDSYAKVGDTSKRLSNVSVAIQGVFSDAVDKMLELFESHQRVTIRFKKRLPRKLKKLRQKIEEGRRLGEVEKRRRVPKIEASFNARCKTYIVEADGQTSVSFKMAPAGPIELR